MKTKNKQQKFLNFFKKLGPGIITGASDDDPSGIATYSQAGAQFGLATLWTALITFPLMISIQEMCARIGTVTSIGLTANIKKHYPTPILILLLLLSVPAIILNIGADIAGMGAVANLVLPAIPAYLFSIIFTAILMIAIIFLPYDKIVAALKYLCLSLLLYLIIPFIKRPDWLQVLQHTFIPTVQFNKEYLHILVAILGTTISPYLFFWQATMEAKNKHLVVNKEEIKTMRKDVVFGMFSSNLVMYFIILTTGTILFPKGIHQVETIEQAASALEPLVGKLSYLLFALGVIGTGSLAIPVLSGSVSYILTSSFNWTEGLDNPFYKAKHFYSIIVISLLIGLGINLIGINPIQALLYTAILYGISAPLLILIILHIANSKKIMGKFVNKKWANVWGFLTFLLMSAAALFLLFFYFFD